MRRTTVNFLIGLVMLVFICAGILLLAKTAFAGIDGPANTEGGLQQAVRIDPPDPPPPLPEPPPPPPPAWPTGIYNLPFAPFGLSDCDEMMFYARQFSLPDAFQAIGWRESNCRNEDGVRTSCCHGYWQLHQMHFSPGGYMDRACGADSYTDVNSDNALEKQKQACAAKQLFDRVGYSAWGL